MTRFLTFLRYLGRVYPGMVGIPHRIGPREAWAIAGIIHDE